MKKTHYKISEYSCPDCGTIFPIPRKRGKIRGKGHIKDLWCPMCKGVKKFKEVY